MMRDLSQPYQCPAIYARGVIELTTLGITMKLPHGIVSWWPDDCGALWKEVGRVTVWHDTAHIDIYPYVGIADEERAVLAGAGWAAWFEPPTADDFWQVGTQGGRSYWECVINLEAFPTDPIAQVIRASEEHRLRQDRLFGEAIGELGSAA
jgi:hypothetical protein